MGSENVGHINLKFTNLKCKMKVRDFNTLKGDHISEKAGKTSYVPCFYDQCTSKNKTYSISAKDIDSSSNTKADKPLDSEIKRSDFQNVS